MKKRAFLTITASALLALMITSCGSDTGKTTSSTEKESSIEEAVTATAEIVEEKEAPSAGQKLFKASGCLACHHAENKLVGPAIKEIKKAYSGDSEGLISFFKGEADPIVDPAQAAVMAPQIETTKAMSDEQRAALADYLLK